MRRAAIFNTYLSVFGGGEKSTYSIGRSLSDLGFEVDVLTFEDQPPTQVQIDAYFGPGHSGFRIRTVGAGADWARRGQALEEALKGYALFVNHCAGSSVPNPCPVGV